MTTVKTLSKGQIVIPAEMRKRYHIKPGTELQIMEYGGMIYLVPPDENPLKTATNLLPSKPSLSALLVRERKAEFK
jgi:AbrB family looped-hinge helix DNA binding protein